MIIQCMYCKKTIRKVKPIDDKRVSHGICKPCYKKFDKEMGALENKAILTY